MYFCITLSDTRDAVSLTHSNPKPIPSTCKPSRFEQSTAIIFSDDLETVSYFIDLLTSRNKLDGISGMYSVPKSAIPSKIQKQGYDWDTGEDMIKYVGINNDLPTMLEWDLTKPSRIDGYTPINKKCFTYPYCFANITNNNGSSLYGQFELADDKATVKFRYYFPCIEGNTSFGYLASYDGVSKNFDKSIQGQTNIELPYVTNTFSAYLSANQNSIANQYSTIDRNEKASIVKTGVNGAMGLIGNIATGNVAGAVSSALGTAEGIGDAMLSSYNQRQAIDSSLKDVESKANVSHGAYTGIGNIICGQIGFKGQLITVTAENIKMIDDYFSMFGYKVNTIKIPQFNSRPYWNYIKTSGINMIGNVPQDALSVIKQMFDNGVTMWHALGYMYRYDEYKRLNV